VWRRAKLAKNNTEPMARATAVPTPANSTSRATLDRTLVKRVTPSSLGSRTSYVRSGTVGVGRGLSVAGARRVALGRPEGSASCCWSTWAGGGPLSTIAWVVA
jgi:hypothetical protein